MSQSIEQRANDIGQWLTQGAYAWPFFAAEVSRRIESLTLDLIAQNNEETRGRIKGLRDVLDMPASLASERDGISAALAQEAAAD